MYGNSLQILDVALSSTSLTEVLRVVTQKIANKEKFWMTTPNPEFLVAAQKNPGFKKILNSVDLSLVDGYGLIWASKFLKTIPRLRERVSGADLVERLLSEAAKKKWKIGIVGARRGDKEEEKILLSRLREKYSGLSVFSLDSSDSLDNPDTPINLVFACHGMIKQENWISENIKKAKQGVFIGVGGSLDFLAGFTKRAPAWMRKAGLEWLWRLVVNPRKHWMRVFNAAVVFPYLVVKEKLK